MQAIQVKYLPPTNHRPARVKAWFQAGSVIVAWNHSQNQSDNFYEAAHKLLRKLGWNWYAIYFVLPNGVWAFVDLD